MLNERGKLQRLLTLLLFLLIAFVSGVLLHTISGRYYGYAIDYIYSKEPVEISTSENLKLRRMVHSLDKTKHDDENDIYRQNYNIPFDSKTTALLLIDAWDYSNHPNDGYAKRMENHLKTKITPLLEFARGNNIKIFHTPNEREISHYAKPLEGEWNLGWLYFLPQKLQTLYFYWLLKSEGISTLLIAGSGLHLCIWERPIGIDKLRHFRGLEMILVRDATITNEYQDFENEPMKKAFLNYLEADRLPSTTIDNLNSALEGK